jgi:hypothetical protein
MTAGDWVGDATAASLSPARAKLQNVLEEYRRKKYVRHTRPHYHGLHHSSAPPSSLVLTSLSLLLLFAYTTLPLLYSFSQTLFSRFLKEMMQAIDSNHDGKISRSELSKLLDNIGAKGKLDATEVQEIMDELGHMDEDEKEMLIHIEFLEEMILRKAS